MASSAASDMKGFYKQKKKNAGITKPSLSKSKKSASIAHASADQDRDANEEVLRQFDMNMAYGPCVGMKRMDRWQRASSLGLNPPEHIHRLLTSAANEVSADSLWDGRV
ncbi:DNA polymerase delta subunit 4 [Tanacetum coccineum]